ncbi:hypothetical protein [Streptacidiphilus cavernicola]|uniref:CobQ/CobB/MinD/ParA nucleotide binding domain-containing protein n=1 Tax=Streptacidiphilus cavernicola TaxID=3342716 RepID=A0ABV6W0P5_9ACTN
MPVVTISGGTGAPGATTTALGLLLAWPLGEGRRVVLLECDPDGGAVLAGALEGRVVAQYGLRHLAVADRRGRLAETLWEQLVDISPDGNGGRLLLPGLTDPAQAAGLAYTWEPLVTACQDLDRAGCDVLIDLGRSGAHGPSAVLARRADAVLVTVRSTLRGLSAAKPRVAALAADLDAEGTGADAIGVVLVQEGPYAPAEVGRALGAPVVGLLPYEPRSARVLSDGGNSADRRLLRSGLMRAVRSTADEILVLTSRRRARYGVVPQTPPHPQPTMTAGRPSPSSPSSQQPQPHPRAPQPGQYERPAPQQPGMPQPGPYQQRPAPQPDHYQQRPTPQPGPYQRSASQPGAAQSGQGPYQGPVSPPAAAQPGPYRRPAPEHGGHPRSRFVPPPPPVPQPGTPQPSVPQQPQHAQQPQQPQPSQPRSAAAQQPVPPVSGGGQPQQAPLAGYAPRQPVPPAFDPASPDGPDGPNGPGQEVARVF